MQIAAQSCGILLMVLLIIFYYSQKRTHDVSTKIYGRLLIILLLSLIFEVIFLLLGQKAVSMGFYSEELKSFIGNWQYFINTSCKLYIFGCTMLTYYGCVYGLIGLQSVSDKFSFILTVALAIIEAIVPINYLVIDDYIFPTNIGCIWAYGISVAFIVWSTVVIVRNIKVIDKLKLYCQVIWLILWLIGMTLQYTFHIGLAGYACVLGLLLIFYLIENPDSKIDKLTGFFTSNYMESYIKSKLSMNKSVVMGVVCSHRQSPNHVFMKHLTAGTDIVCFKDADSYCYLFSSDGESLINVLDEYRNQNDAVVCVYTFTHEINMILFLNYIKRNLSSWSNSTLHVIDDDVLKMLEDDDKVHIDIISALLEKRIITYIQPIYDLRENKFVSGECLCRLQQRNGEIISPYKFIPVAERTGLIADIETAMFRNMCKCLSDKRLYESDIKFLEANLSIKKGEKTDLVDEYSEILNEYNIPTCMVNLEITETDVVEEKMSILDNMTRMCDLGFKFSLDDFGTGESNLGYIIDMPVSTIKFDREITQKAMINDKAFTIVKNVISMVHELGIKVVVEGVETEDDMRACRLIDADFVQGYFFSKPLPMDEFIDFVLKPIPAEKHVL